MEFLNLFWNFDADNKTKFFVFAIIALMALCILCKPKGKKKESTPTINSNNNAKPKMNNPPQPLTKCQIDYKVCQENTKRGNLNKNMCFQCKPNGDFPNQIYYPSIGWINVDPKTGKPLG